MKCVVPIMTASTLPTPTPLEASTAPIASTTPCVTSAVVGVLCEATTRPSTTTTASVFVPPTSTPILVAMWVRLARGGGCGEHLWGGRGSGGVWVGAALAAARVGAILVPTGDTLGVVLPSRAHKRKRTAGPGRPMAPIWSRPKDIRAVPRKGELVEILELLVQMPWWVGVGLAPVAFFGLPPLMGAFAEGTPLVGFVPLISGILAFGLLVGGVLSAIRSARQRTMLAANRTKEAIRSLDWDRFEELVEAHYRSEGYSVRRDGGSGPDGGVDLRLRSANGGRHLVQCKQWRSQRVGVKVVRELYGVVAAEGADGGTVVTAGTFTPDAIRFAKGIPMQLVDGDRLEAMIGGALSGLDADTPATNAETDERVCPRCGSALVLRSARRGPKAGSNFYGCSAYPKCRFTQDA